MAKHSVMAAAPLGIESKAGKAKLCWAKIDGLTTEDVASDSGAASFGHDHQEIENVGIGRGLFASISLFGRSTRQKSVGEEAASAAKNAPYSPQRGTYAYEALQKRFKDLDQESPGCITENGLKTALKSLNLPASEQDIQAFLGEFTEAAVPFDQFAQYAVNRENVLFDTFKELDKRNTGYLTKDELKKALQKYNFRFSDKDITAIVQKYHVRAGADPNNQNQLFDFADYRNFLMLFSNRDLRDSNAVWGRAIIDVGDLDVSFPLSSDAKKVKAGHRHQPEIFKHLALGAISAAVSRTLVSPLERLKVLSMVDNKISSEPVDLLKHIWRDEGPRGLLRGNLLNVARIIPTRVTEFLVYDKLKEAVLKRRKQPNITSLDRMLLGSIASMAGVVAGYPLDTLRTVIAAQMPSRHIDDLLAKSIIQNGGLPNMYKGVVPNLIRAIPYGLISFTIFDRLQEGYRKKVGPGGDIGAPSNVLFGILAAAAAQTVVHPLEVVQRRLQVEAANQGAAVYHNMFNAFRVILEKEGAAGLYAGLLTSYAKIVPAAAISMVIYNTLKEKLDEPQPQ